LSVILPFYDLRKSAETMRERLYAAASFSLSFEAINIDRSRISFRGPSSEGE
jgi:hypothetical protein